MNDSSNSSNTGLMNEAQAYPGSGYAWYVVFILYLTYTLSFVDRAIINFLVDPIRADLLINDFQFSLIQGMAFTITYSIMGIPLGRLADSRTRRASALVKSLLQRVSDEKMHFTVVATYSSAKP